MDKTKYWLALDPAKPGEALLFGDARRVEKAKAPDGTIYEFDTYGDLVSALCQTDGLKDVERILIAASNGVFARYDRKEFPDTPLPPEDAIDRVFGHMPEPESSKTVRIRCSQESPEGQITTGGAGARAEDRTSAHANSDALLARLARVVRRHGGGIADFLAVAEILEA